MTHESSEKSESSTPLTRENGLFHVLISQFAWLKRWHLEVSFAESELNCFLFDSSKAGFSIPLACLAVTRPPAAAQA